MSFTIGKFLAQLLKYFGDLTDDVEAMANNAVAVAPDLAAAKEQFVDAYIEKWRGELTLERARARGSLIWEELHSKDPGFDSEAGSSA